MRIPAIAFLLAVLSCASVRPPEVFTPMDGDRIDLFYSDMGSANLVNLSVNGTGSGRFEIKRNGRHSVGTFAMSQDKLDQLKEHLLPYRLQAVPTSQRAGRSQVCVGRYTPHLGAIVVRWVESESDAELYVSRSCDAERFKTRNDHLIAIVENVARPLAR